MTNGFRTLFAVLLMQTASYADTQLFWPRALKGLQSESKELGVTFDEIQARVNIPKDPKCYARYSENRSTHQELLNQLYLAFVQDFSGISVRKNMGDDFEDMSGSEAVELFTKAFVQKRLDIQGLNWSCYISEDDIVSTHAIGVAQLHGLQSTIEAFIRSGADINGVDDAGARPLEYALKLKDPRMANFLVAQGARLTGWSYLRYVGTESLLALMLPNSTYFYLAQKSWFKYFMSWSNWVALGLVDDKIGPGFIRGVLMYAQQFFAKHCTIENTACLCEQVPETLAAISELAIINIHRLLTVAPAA